MVLFAGACPADSRQQFYQNAAVELNARQNQFAFDLYNRLISESGGQAGQKNLFFSPYSLSSAMAMTWAGAKGQTEKQIAQVFYFTSEQDYTHSAFSFLRTAMQQLNNPGGIELHIANRLWGQSGFAFLEDYLNLIKLRYDAPLETVDFVAGAEKSRRKINGWVEEQTNNKIKDLIQPGALGPGTRLVLTNAIYFKGQWQKQFNKKSTKTGEFFITADGNISSVNTQFMNVKDKFGYFRNDLYELLELPYNNSELAMIILLPNERCALQNIEPLIDANSVQKSIEMISKKDIIVFVPKFSLTGEFELNNMLGKMGMPLAFTTQADFSGITGGRDLFISNVIHKAFVDVSEEGTEAAAATGVGMAVTSVPAEPAIFHANHPFMFMILHKPTNTILFIGRLAKP